MGSGAPSHPESLPGDIPALAGAGQNPREDAKEATASVEGCGQEGPGGIGALGSILVRTIRHFWPRMGEWLGRLPDTRFEPMVVYDKKFLTWWGLCLFLLKLGGRRQLDFHLRDLNTHGHL
mgnify:FL=1